MKIAEAKAIAALDGWECHYCGEPLGWGHESVTAPHIEHVWPRSRSECDLIENLALACPTCNSAKGTRTPAEWLGVRCCDRHLAAEKGAALERMYVYLRDHPEARGRPMVEWFDAAVRV